MKDVMLTLSFRLALHSLQRGLGGAIEERGAMTRIGNDGRWKA